MFGIGITELIIICVFALIFVGPKKLPELMRQAGRFFVQVRRTTNDVKSTFDQVVREAEEEIRREEREALKAAMAIPTAVTKSESASAPTGEVYDPHKPLEADAPEDAKD